MEGGRDIIPTLDQQVEELMKYQPNLILSENNEKLILKGLYHYDLNYDGTRYINTKEIVIHIYKNFPHSAIKLYVKDLPSDMEHINPDGSVCLAAYTEIRSFLRLKPTVLDFINKFFHSFFYSLEWFERYKQYPFGERSHGRVGMLEYYLEKWNVDEELFKKFALLLFKEKYRGHLECLCGSGLKIRKCHGNYLENIIKDDVLLTDLFVDFCYIYNLKEPSNENQ